MNKQQAEAAGFTVDTSVYPWLAYKGERAAPIQRTHIETPAWSPAASMVVRKLDGAREDSRRRRIAAVVRWIEANYATTLQVSMLADQFAMSERTLSRLFKQATGVTPAEYLQKTRLERVAAMLQQTDLTVDVIARRCGYSSGEAIARVFRRRYGTTATSFRALGHGTLNHEQQRGGAQC